MPQAPPPNYHPLVRRVAQALRQRCGVTSGSTIVVACSGGADSVALLHALAILAKRRRWRLKLIVAHIHHHLRQDAPADAAFVQQLAHTLGLPYQQRDIHPGNQPGNTEANARRLRYQALTDIALTQDATLIATAHHADDQLETLLMRLLRGASVAGLRGIAWRRRLPTEPPNAKAYAIRPMLAVPKEDITSLLDQLRQPWREDATNRDTTRTRAKLRHDIIPLLKSLQPDAANKANTLADHFAQLHQLIKHTAKQAHPSPGPATTIPRSQARTLNPLVLAQLLRRALIDAGVPSDQLPAHALKPAVKAAQDPVGGERNFPFANRIKLKINRDTLRVLSDQ